MTINYSKHPRSATTCQAPHLSPKMERIFGKSKTTFINSCIIPANDNDRFNDNKCAFCWDVYSDSHVAARILPCNHVLGRDCILEAIDAPNGDLCMICRTPLFRPSWRERLMRFAIAALQAYGMAIYALECKITALFMSLPRSIRHILRAVYCFRDGTIILWFLRMFEHYTGLQARNPELRLGEKLTLIVGLRPLQTLAYSEFRLHVSKWLDGSQEHAPTVDKVTTPVAIASALLLAFGACIFTFIWVRARDKVVLRRDKITLVVFMFVVFVANHAFDIMALGCYLTKRDLTDFYSSDSITIQLQSPSGWFYK